MSVSAQTDVRSMFKIVPTEYFNIACCEGNADEYAKKYVTAEDNENGYMKGDDTEEDAKYAGFVLKIFPSKSRTIVGLYSHSINWDDYYFLELRSGKLINISKTIPRYSQDNVYEFPRKGNTIKVYRKKYANADKSINVDGGVSRGKFLYRLSWQNGKFIAAK
jgi:hypothetical protein